MKMGIRSAERFRFSAERSLAFLRAETPSVAPAGSATGRHLIKLKQSIESFINASTDTTTGSESKASSASSSEVRGGRKQKRLRLVLPGAVQQLASSALFRSRSNNTDEGSGDEESSTGPAGAASAAAGEAEQAAAVSRCMRQLRVPSTYRYALRQNIALVVGRETLGRVAETWDRLERALMAGQRQ